MTTPEPKKLEACPHNIISVKRRASGYHRYSYHQGTPKDPWEFIDDVGELAIPAFGKCEDCGRNVRVPKEVD